MSDSSWNKRILFAVVLYFSAFSLPAATLFPNSVPALIAAINGASNGDIIDLGGATFTLDLANYANDLTDGINGLPTISVALTIQNGAIERDSSLSNIATDNEHFRLFHIASGASLSLSHIALLNGLAASGTGNGLFGGAIYNLGALHLDDVVFIENVAVDRGGAIYSEGTIPIINSSIFIDNLALGIASIGTQTGLGGAIYNINGAIGDITASIFFRNRAGELSGGIGGGGGGGAIANVFGGTIARIIDTIFFDNSSPGQRGRGGAILGNCTTLIGSIEGSFLVANNAFSIGGAINLDNENNDISVICAGTTAINLITDTIISGNSVTGDPNNINAGFGGAIALAQAARIEEISCSTFDDNTAEKGGGAIFNFGANTVITEINSTTFSNNVTQIIGGGAIFTLFGATVGRLSNSTIFGNAAGPTGGGGGILLVNNGIINEISNTTIYGNISPNSGGGILSVDSTINNLTSTIVAGNTAVTFPDINLINSSITQASFNLIGTDVGHSIINNSNNNQVGSLLAPLDPLLGPLTDNGGTTQTLALLENSPAIDTGDNPNNLEFDQRCGNGSIRSAGPHADIGAFECQDYDRDNVCDVNDNCPTTANPAQQDSDNDGVGNACKRGSSGGGGLSIYWPPPPPEPELCPVLEPPAVPVLAIESTSDCSLPKVSEPSEPLQNSCSIVSQTKKSNTTVFNTETAPAPFQFQDETLESGAGCSTTKNSESWLFLFMLFVWFYVKTRNKLPSKS